jgi:hypothetical protein
MARGPDHLDPIARFNNALCQTRLAEWRPSRTQHRAAVSVLFNEPNAMASGCEASGHDQAYVASADDLNRPIGAAWRCI